jgi:hypothetical protein
MAISLPRRRLGGVDRRGGGDTIRRVDGGANCCGEDADDHGGDDADSCGEDPDDHGGDDADSCGEDPDDHGGDDADCSSEDPDDHGGDDADCSSEDPDDHGGDDADCSSEDSDGWGDADGHGWAGAECHAGGVGCGSGGANVGDEKVGCPGGEDTPSHGAVGCQPGSGSGDGKSAVGHCSAVTSVPQETQNRADSSGRGCPHDGHQRATVPPKSAPPGRFHAVPGPAPLPVSPATEVPLPYPAPGDHSLQSGLASLEQELNGVPDGQQRIHNRRRVSHPAISTCSRPPRICLSGSGLPTAVPAPRDARLAAIAGARTAGPKRRTSCRIYGPAGCPDGILGTACPPPKTAANPHRRPDSRRIGPGLGRRGNHMPRHRNV